MRAWAASLAVLIALVAAGCVTVGPSGNALLPEGIDEVKLPQVDSRGYLYFNTGAPITVSGGLFNVSLPNEEIPESIFMDNATLILGTTTNNIGVSLRFSSMEDSQAAWNLVADTLDAQNVWGRRIDEQLYLTTGDQPWRETIKDAYLEGNLVPVNETFPSDWSLLSNLPESPPSRPVMAGVLKLDAELLRSLMASVNLEADGIGNAFGLVRVDSMAFAVYTDDPLHMSTEFDYEHLLNSGSGILLVSRSSYPGPIVSFMLGVMSDRTDLELIELATTNARYRTVDDLHLIIKNRGSLLYAAIATSRTDAEELMISALFN